MIRKGLIKRWDIQMGKVFDLLMSQIQAVPEGEFVMDTKRYSFLNRADEEPMCPIGNSLHSWENGPVFLYMQGIDDVSFGSLVTYDPVTSVVLELATEEILKAGACAAAAMADIGADRWGWFQISGIMDIKVGQPGPLISTCCDAPAISLIIDNVGVCSKCETVTGFNEQPKEEINMSVNGQLTIVLCDGDQLVKDVKVKSTEALADEAKFVGKDRGFHMGGTYYPPGSISRVDYAVITDDTNAGQPAGDTSG